MSKIYVEKMENITTKIFLCRKIRDFDLKIREMEKGVYKIIINVIIHKNNVKQINLLYPLTREMLWFVGKN